MKWKAKPLICFWLSYVIFLSSVWKNLKKKDTKRYMSQNSDSKSGFTASKQDTSFWGIIHPIYYHFHIKRDVLCCPKPLLGPAVTSPVCIFCFQW